MFTRISLPRVIECFKDRANKELPYGFHAVPRTLDRTVAIFYGSKTVFVLSYGSIENDIVGMLDALPHYVREYRKVKREGK